MRLTLVRPKCALAPTIRFVPKEERSRDNSFLDRERFRWKSISLISLLGAATAVLVVLAVLD